MYRSPSWYGHKAGIGTWDYGPKATEVHDWASDWHVPSRDWFDWEYSFESWRSPYFDFGDKWHGCGGHPHGHRDRHPPKIEPEHEFSVVLSDLEHGLELGDLQASDNRGVTEFRIQSQHPDTDGDGTAPFAVAPDGTLIVTDHHDVDFGADGQIQLTVTAHDGGRQRVRPLSCDADSSTRSADPDEHALQLPYRHQLRELAVRPQRQLQHQRGPRPDHPSTSS